MQVTVGTVITHMYPSVDGPSYGLWAIGYWRQLLVRNEDLMPPKSMGYEPVWVMTSMG